MKQRAVSAQSETGAVGPGAERKRPISENCQPLEGPRKVPQGMVKMHVQQKIRKPSQLIAGADANIFIVGETYSNDQAWVEGAYCTAGSVLNDFFGIKPIIDNRNHPFICPCS